LENQCQWISAASDLSFDSRESVAFEIFGKLYVAGGKEGDPAAIRRYDPLTNSWTNLTGAPIPITAELASFTYQNRQYFVNSDKVIWAFDPIANTWVNFETYPDTLGEGYGMAQVIGNKAYIGLYRKSQTIWELDLVSKKWTKKNSIPGIPQTVTVGHFEKDGNIYLMRAIEFNLGSNIPMEFYRFDPNGI
jgi:N-acetylneuraminic acid mutarotase